jgi:hypothetical protein
MFKNYYLVVLAILISPTALALENFVTQASTLYPPACLSTGAIEEVNTPSVSKITFASQLVNFTAYPDTDLNASVEIEIVRRGCKDPERSVILVSMSLINGGSKFFLPRFFAKIDGEKYPLRLANEPNSFEQDYSGALQGTGRVQFVLDGPAESKIANTDNLISIAQYNGAFTLVLQDGFDETLEYEVPAAAYTGFQRPLNFPINGRMTGNWVSAGAADQGFLISFNEFIDGNGVQNMIFLSWYTFNVDGTTLWLVANEFHDIATSSVDLNIQLVTDGAFLGDKQVQRTDVGSATLTAESCGEMTFEYDLEALGLGTGTITLTRIFSLEIAGYACRDQTARLDAQN